MKNIFNSLMTLAAAAAALVSCSREEVEVKDNNEFVYRFEIAEGETRATLNRDGVWWKPGEDIVGVVVGNENIPANVVVNSDSGKKEISFTSATAIAPGTRIYSYYPYSEAVTSADAAQVTIPTNQEGGSVSAMPMAGIPIYLESAAGAACNGRIKFLNLGAIIDFRIYSTNADYANETVESITFMSDSDEAKASGTATIDLTAFQGGENPSAPDMTMSGVSNRRATLKQSVPVAANRDAATTPMYLVVAPGTFSGTVTVNTNAASYTFTLTDKTLARNTITKFNMNIGSSKAEREALTKTYEYVSGNLTADTYLIAGSENNKLSVALFPNVSTTSWNSTQTGAVNDGQIITEKQFGTNNALETITTDDPTIVNSEVELIESGNAWLVKVKKTGKYLVAPAEEYRISFTDDITSAGVFTASTPTDGKRNLNYSSEGSAYYVYHAGSANGFTIRVVSTSNLRFYKLSGSTKSQTLSFQNVPENGLTWDLASQEDFVEPTLLGAKTTVVYTSSNTAIANVDATTGEVEFGTKTGTVTITATAAEMDGYASASASYKIVVSNSNAPAVTYYKASLLESGYDYIIVSNGQALKNNGNGNMVAASQVTVKENNTIDLYEDETEGILWRAAEVTSNYGTHTLVNNSIFLYRNGYQGTITLTGNTTSTGNYIPWRYDGEHLWNGSGSPYYAYYNDGWKISKTDVPSVTTVLFTERQPQIMSFNPTEKTYDKYVGGEFVEPVLSGDITEVTYSSNNTSVATVDINSGEVTPLEKGTATITARAASTTTYQGAVASYTLTVIDSTPQSRNLQFSASNYSVAITDTPNPPTLTGGKTDDVTYSSSDTNVADVDPETGALSLHSVGETRIAAYAAPVTGWQEGTAYYDLTVTEAPSAVTYTKVMSSDELAVDDVIIFVYENGDASKVFKPILNSNKNRWETTSNNAVTAAVEAGEIVSAYLASCQITLKNQDGNNPKYDMVVPKADGETDYYFILRNNSTSFVAATSSSYRATFTINNGTLTLTRGSYYLCYNGSSSYFQASTSNPSNMAIYKMDDGKPKDRNLAFTPNEVSVSIYEKTVPIALSELATVPTLSGKTDGGVTYSVTCNDTNIPTTSYPTVSATGDVTVNGVGVFTITASAAATLQGTTPAYRAGEASYTLTVTNDALPTYSFITPSEFVSGGTYLIVSSDAVYNGKNYNELDKMRAFAGDQAGSAVEVDGTSGTITGDYSSCEFIISESGSDYTLYGPEGYVTGNSSTSYSRYIQVSSSAVTMSLTDAATLEAATTPSQGNDKDGKVANAFYFYYTKGSGSSASTEVLYFNSDGKYKIGGTGRKYGVYLYKKN